MKSKIDWVRRSQRVIRMVGELHRMGYQRLRIMPYKHPMAWRLAVAPHEYFSEKNGAFIPHNMWGDIPITGAGSLYFGWEDAKTDDARDLAEKFVSRFPDMAKQGWGRDWAYAGWLAELIGFLEGGDWLPVTYWEYMKGDPAELQFLPIWEVNGKNIDWIGYESVPGSNARTFPLPPICEIESPARTDEHVSSKITLLSLAAEGGGLDLVLQMTPAGIYSYRLDSYSSEAAMFDDEDFSDLGSFQGSTYKEAPLVIDWQGALKLLDDRGWPWPMFTPLYVHPSVAPQLFTALKDRYSRYPDIDFKNWGRFFR